MRIIGGKDFYDGAVPFDTDSTRCFAREKPSNLIEIPLASNPLHVGFIKTIEENRYPHTWRENIWNINGISTGIFEVFVYFAGKKYKGVEIRQSNIRNGLTIPSTFLWSKSAAEKWCSAHEMELKPYSTYQYEWTQKHIDDYWDAKEPKAEIQEFLMDNKILVAFSLYSPFWRWNEKAKWQVNTDQLKTINFGSRLDSWTAYQELDMYIGSILVNDQDHMVKISDKSMIAKHGYDKWSFRNQKHRGKPRAAKT